MDGCYAGARDQGGLVGSRVAYSETFVDGCSGSIGFRADFAYSCDASYLALYSGKGYKMDD